MILGVKQRIKEGSKPKPTRYFSDKQEKQVAKKVGGKQTSNSGATDFGGKGDLVLSNMILECKTKMTPSQQITIKKEWLDKVAQEKVFMGKEHSALAFNFGPDEQNYYIIDEYLFQDLLDYLSYKGK